MFSALVTEDWEDADVTPDDTRTNTASPSSKGKSSKSLVAESKEDADSELSSDGSDEYKPENKAPKVCPWLFDLISISRGGSSWCGHFLGPQQNMSPILLM